MPSNLVTEAESLIERLSIRLGDCFVEHPHLGDIPKPDTPRTIRRIKRMLWKARRRLNRRKSEAGIPLSIAGAMWIINQADAGYF